jgi:hypothetical protein
MLLRESIAVKHRTRTTELAAADDDGGAAAGRLVFASSMRRLTTSIIALAMFAIASSAQASTLQLVAPAGGATLRGGSFAELRWSSAELPAAAEEWEAFLSVDGGRYYAFRVTPHLDIELERFTFLVPNVDTSDARILIRAGDEKHETEFESAGTFSIVRDANAELAFSRLPQSGHGEAARNGDPEVLAWTDGARDGSGLALRSSVPMPSPSLEVQAKRSYDNEPLAVAAANGINAPSVARTHVRAAAFVSCEPAQYRLPADLLLVCRRRNI